MRTQRTLPTLPTRSCLKGRKRGAIRASSNIFLLKPGGGVEALEGEGQETRDVGFGLRDRDPRLEPGHGLVAELPEDDLAAIELHGAG